jgi:hypothetical protein
MLMFLNGIVFLSFLLATASAQTGPDLAIERNPPYYGKMNSFFVRNDDAFYVSGSFKPPFSAYSDSVSQVLSIGSNGQILNRIILPDYSSIFAFPFSTPSILQGVFSDGSLLMDDPVAQLGRERVRVFQDGRIDNEVIGLPTGPVALQKNGQFILGAGESDSYSPPLQRIYLRRSLAYEREVVTRDEYFAKAVEAQEPIRKMSCAGLALGADDSIWAWFVPKLDPLHLATLFRFTSDGRLDPAFAPSRPVVSERHLGKIVPLADGRVMLLRFDREPILERRNKDGSVDRSFQTEFGEADELLDVAPSGDFVVQSVSTPDGPKLVRHTADSSLDKTFRPAPEIRLPVRRVLRQHDGKLWVVSGTWDVGGLFHPLLRLNADWSLDSTFSEKIFDPYTSFQITARNLTPGTVYEIQLAHAGPRWPEPGHASLSFVPETSEQLLFCYDTVSWENRNMTFFRIRATDQE